MKRLLLALLISALPFTAKAADELFRMVTWENLYYGTTSANNATELSSFVYAVRLICTTACRLAVDISGTTPHASTSTGSYLPANTPWEILAEPGMEIGVTADVTQGTLNIIQLSR